MENKYPAWLETSAFVLLLLNIPLIILETFPAVAGSFPVRTVEWLFTGLFTLEYVARIALAQVKKAYIFSLNGLIDLVAVLPQYLLFFFPVAHDLFALRLLRLFRLLAKGFRASRAGRAMLDDMLSLREHFAADEQVLYRESMSRLHYLKGYVLYSVLAVGAGAGAVVATPFVIKGIPVLSLALYVLVIAALLILWKKEFVVGSQRYAITSHRILSSTTVLERHVTSISLLQVTDVSLHQSLTDRLCTVGTVVIRTSGEVNAMEMVGIRNPIAVKQLIHQAIITLNRPPQR